MQLKPIQSGCSWGGGGCNSVLHSQEKVAGRKTLTYASACVVPYVFRSVSVKRLLHLPIPNHMT